MVELKRKLPVFEDKSLERYFSEIGRIELLDRGTETELARRSREEGDEAARAMLVRANLRFVVSLAFKYRDLGLPLADLISEGNLGLLNAARHFDERRGVKFISYAVWWIRQSILYALSETSRPIRIPMNRINDLMRIGRYRREFTRANQRPPTADELARLLGMKATEIESLTTLYGRQAAEEWDGGNALMEGIEDPNQTHPLAERSQESLRQVVERELSGLKPVQARVLRLYFGLNDDGVKYSLARIGRELGLTRERIRQIKLQALKHLRRGSHILNLEPFHN